MTGKVRTEVVLMDETPEQAARAISSALDFLRLEADAIGMFDVSELIGQAHAKANEYRPDGKVPDPVTARRSFVP